MKKALLTLMCFAAMMAASVGLKAQEVTIPLNPGWTWISYPNSDTLSIDSALSLFSPAAGDIIKSQWGNASYVGGQWRGNFSQFYPGYGYMYKSNQTTPVPFAFPINGVITPDTVNLNPGWTWISYPHTDTLDIESALGTFTPTAGDIIKSQWGNASYVGGHWRGNFSQFYPGYGYMYKSNLTTSVPFAFANDEVVNPTYVPIDWNNAILLSANHSTGTYQIQFNGGIPELHSGSIITIDQDTVVHHVFVETVSVNGNTMNLTSTEAYLTDIFAVTGFTLTTATNGKSSAKGKVFYPVAAYQYDEQGVYKPLDLQGMRDNRWSFTHNLWHYGENYDGEELFSGNNYSIYMEQLNFDFDLDLEIYMNFSGRYIHEIVGHAIDRYRSQALVVDAALLGTFNTEQKVRCDIEGSCSYSPGYDIWKHNLFRPLRVRFMVYGVPVIITLNSDLYRQVEVTASGEISAYAGFSDNAQGRVGFEWRQTGGISPLATFSNTFELTPPTVEGKGMVEAKAWAFPRVRLLLYDVVGPSFDFKPYLSTTVSGGFREEMLGQSNDFCAWSLDCNAGIDAACGLSLQFMGYEVQNYSTPNWNIVDRLLYHSPKRIQKASAGTGQTRTVSFDVYDRNHLFNTDVLTPLPQFVKFEANGQLSSEYGIAQNGRVTVNWTPANNDILYAKLYDIDGNVLAWDTVQANNDPQGDWVDLGLPSGLLWATRNVGASSPEDYGSYFAWAETQPKSVYNWSTYQYTCNNSYYGMTKYCNRSDYGCNGYTDNLTILQPGDDAATVHYGGRMPTSEEWQELRYNCTSVWTTRNGVNGRLFTGPNGNTLFLPAAGYRSDGDLRDAGNYCIYWANSLDAYAPDSAWGIGFNSYYTSVSSYYNGRDYGRSVRAVRSGQN